MKIQLWSLVQEAFGDTSDMNLKSMPINEKGLKSCRMIHSLLPTLMGFGQTTIDQWR